MELKIVEVPNDTSGIAPLPEGYEYASVWLEPRMTDGYRRYKILHSSYSEVARVDLATSCEREHFLVNYRMPSGGLPLLKIEFIEVREKFRERGIGTCIVRQLEYENPNYSLVASAAIDAEEFWRTLNWQEISSYDPQNAPLFISR